MVKIAILVLSRQCLNRRIPDLERIKRETVAWEKEPNQKSNI